MPNTRVPAAGEAVPATQIITGRFSRRAVQITARKTIATASQEGVKSADMLMHAVRCYSDGIADLMKKLHGGDWRVHIDHEATTCFVLIRPAAEKPIAKADLRRAI